MIQHSQNTEEWYTPAWLVEIAQKTLLGIDLDPATTGEVNQMVVKATNYYTAAEDGLYQPWHGNVFCNPPGGRNHCTLPEFQKFRSKTAAWWHKATLEYSKPTTHAVFFIGFNPNVLFTTLDCPYPMANSTFCLLRKRVRFIDQKTWMPAPDPAHHTVVALLETDGAMTRRFIELMKPHGKICSALNLTQAAYEL